eukprot:GHVR01046622.1.p1 GENE.GHVR01046622.1~~GHVR01046622.1.p1  ORF type:complete len:105 (+),score=3.89 GHVR01046622.1:1226-1540(+)
MGYWKAIIVFICYTSIITNIMLFAFSSQQIVSFFPKLFEGGKDFLYGNVGFSDVFGGAASVLSTMINPSLLSNITGSLNMTDEGLLGMGSLSNTLKTPLFPTVS